MKRSSKHSLKFTNKFKQDVLVSFIVDYKMMLQKYINMIWSNQKLQANKLLNSKQCNIITTNRVHDSRIRQCCAKQACSIVRGTLLKDKQRKYKLKELQKQKVITKYLQKTIEKAIPAKPTVDKISIELDSRFVDFQVVSGEFDLFIKISQIGNKETICIPVKHTSVSRKWLLGGKMLNSIRLTNDFITIIFDIPDKPKKTAGSIVGADQGIATCLTLSDKQVTRKDSHGHDLNSILQKLARRQKGSQGFQEAQQHRKNYINWSINQLNFTNIKQVNIEKIKYIRKGKSSSRYASGWTYTDIKSKLIGLAEVEGFTLVEQDNKFRSQRCSSCGWVHKSNRFKKVFRCSNSICGCEIDADLNAALNHEIELCDLTNYKVWSEHMNRSSGFYWLESSVLDHCMALIVPYTKKE